MSMKSIAHSFQPSGSATLDPCRAQAAGSGEPKSGRTGCLATGCLALIHAIQQFAFDRHTMH